MKNEKILIRYLIAFLLVALGNLSVSAQDQTWARKMFKETNHDFGTVVRGEEVEYRFEIENVFQEEMRIESVTSSCGCTKASLTQNVLKTWEKGYVVAKFDTLGFSGARSARLTVRFAKPYFAEVYLDVKGTIRTDTSITPGSIDFGTFSDVNATPKTVTITRYGNPNWKIVDVKSSFPHVSVSLKEMERNYNRVTYQMTAGLKDSLPRGFIQSELMVVVSDSPNSPNNETRLPVPITGRFTSPLQISPSVLNIANIKAGEEVSKKVIVKADQPFTLTDVVCENNAFRVVADDKPKKVHIVEVFYKAEQNSTDAEAKLKFVTDLPSNNTAELSAVVSMENQ
ncbi:MAG: DUF1573 domain-containing protein [Pirellulaceae bacterium]